jgi:hypothetical protein
LGHKEEPVLQELPDNAALYGDIVRDILSKDGQVQQADQSHGALDPP